MSVDDVPDNERKLAAKEVADKVLSSLATGVPCCSDQISCDCDSNTQSEKACCPI